MYCGNNEDDQELLGPGPSGTPATCGSPKLSSQAACSQDCEGNGQGACKRDQTGAGLHEGLCHSEGSCQSSACMKCKTARAVVLVRQREPLCQTCLEAGVSGKVRALKSNKLLLPGDNVALAFSGGFSSQTLLCNVLAMRKAATTPRKERGKIEFGLSVIHVNEATAHGLDVDAADAHGRVVTEAAQRCGAGGPTAAIHVVPLSDVFLWLDRPSEGRQQQHQQQHQQQLSQEQQTCGIWEPGPRPTEAPREMDVAEASASGIATRAAAVKEDQTGEQRASSGASASSSGSAAEAREARLQALLKSVPDPTGRQDLVRHLRTRLLAAVAVQLGAGKVLSGDTATGLAARVIADTAKGRGYSLPGGIQLLDARGVAWGEPAVLQPMREVTLKEAVFFCRLRGLGPAHLPTPASRGAGERRSLNSLAASFVDNLQANLPSTIFTILRTAAALKPFPFNSLEALALPPGAPAAPPAAAGGGCGSEPAGSSAAPPGALLRRPACCALCRAPLTRREQEAIAAAAAGRVARLQQQLEKLACPDTAAGVGTSGAAPTGAGAGLNGHSSISTGVATAVHAGALPIAEQGSSPAVAEDGLEGEDGDEELGAPFCTSCRSQVLFTPEQSAGTFAVDGVSSLMGGVGVGLIAASKTLALLPAAFR